VSGFPKLGNQRGVVIEVVLLGCLVVFILAVSMMDIGAMRIQAASSRYRQTQAFYAAEAGIARVTADLSEGRQPDWTREEQAIGDAFYSVSVERSEGGAVTVNSTGEFRRPNGKRIAVPVEVVLQPAAGDGGYEVVSWRRVKS